MGYPILAGIADFWTSRLASDTPGAVIEGLNDGSTFSVADPAPAGSPCASNPGACPLHITDVIPPTEFYHHTADSVYTSASAKVALERAVQAAQELGLPSNSGWASWSNASSRLYIPFTTFSQLSASGVKELPGLGPIAPLAASNPAGGVHPYFTDYKWGDGKVQLLDPVMLWWPLGVTDTHPTAGAYSQSRQAFLSDLSYYAASQDPGGSVAFSWAVNSIAFAEGDDAGKAAHFYTRSYDTFVFGPFKVWAEGSGGWGVANFVTGE